MVKKFGLFFGMILLLFAGVFTSCDKNEEIFDAPQVTNPVNEVKEPQESELRAASGNFIEPDGWDLVEDLGAEYGYKLYKNGDDYVQKVNLSMGATISIGFGRQKTNREKSTSPLFERDSLTNFWERKNDKAISVVNCSFFGYNGNNKDMVFTPFSFPIKIGNKLRSTGSYPDDKAKRILVLGGRSALIKPFVFTKAKESEAGKNLSRYSTAICGYSPDVELSSFYLPRYTGRTMIGVYDQNGDGKNEVLYILSGKFFQSSAKKVLIDFGCKSENIVMFDGSDSAQMIMENPKDRERRHSFQENLRTIPNVLYVLRP